MKKLVVNVRSQEEWDYVIEKLKYYWLNVGYNLFKEDSCILLNEPAFGELIYCKENNYTIISFEEFKSRYEPSDQVVNIIKKFSANLNKMIEYTLDYGRDNIFKDLKELTPKKNKTIEEIVEEIRQKIKKQEEMKEVNLTIEQAKEFIPKDKWKEFGIEEEIVLKDWEELNLSNMSHLFYKVPTKKHAKSMLAFAKLSMLMADLGEECKVNWCNGKRKYTIIVVEDVLYKDYSIKEKEFLAFKTEKIRDAFFDKHEKLIKEYEML